jgi:hypothetical protein
MSTVYPCPHCGQPFALDVSYLAQYGGQVTVCSRCQQQFTLPTALQVQVPQAYPQTPAIVQPPAQQAEATMLGYATPQALAQQAGMPLWRERNLLVTVDQAKFPHACVRCGQPGSGRPYRRVYYWHSPWVYLILLASPLVYIIVAMCIRGKATVDLSLCAGHRSARGRNIAISWLVFLSSFVWWYLAATVRGRDLPPLLVIGGFLTFFGGMIAILLSARILAPKKVDRGYVWLSGAGGGFLNGLPPAG